MSQHPGIVRRRTEDWAACGMRNGRLACALCDGMGGMRHGARAARRTAETFLDLCLHDERSLLVTWPPSIQRVQLELSGVLARLQAELRERRVATTFTGLALQGLSGRLYHVGDSRAYLSREGTLKQLSTDHHLNSAHPEMLCQALGAPQRDRLQHQDLDLADGDGLLLCSDGYSQAGLDVEGLRTLLAGSSNDDEIPALLQEEALKRGAQDNLSLIWVRLEGKE